MRGLLITSVTALIALALGASVASAQQTNAVATATASPADTVSPALACSPRSVCIWPNNDFTGGFAAGGPVTLPTDQFNGAWMTFGSVGAGNPNPGSLDDNSNSVMWVFAKDIGRYRCLPPGEWPLNHSFGWFFIQFGVTSCSSQHPAGP